MLLHKNNLFIFKNAAGFKLPNGLCLEEDLPVSISDSIALCAPDNSFNIEVCVSISSDDARSYLEDVFKEGEYLITNPIHAVKINDVDGFAVEYETSGERHEEYALEIPYEGAEHVILNIWLMKKKNIVQNDELYAEAKAELLAGITLL